MSGAPFVDFHCHLDLYPDFPGIVAECEAAQIRTLAVTTTPRAWPYNVERLRDSRYVRAALGIHPQLAAKEKGSLKLFERYLPEARYIGEIGLDASPAHYKTLDLQKKYFEHILRVCAEYGGKILTIHSVRAARTVLDLLEATVLPGSAGVVLHWFTGTRADLRRAAELGCYFSVNATMLRAGRTKALVAEIPLDRLLTETDGPFTEIEGRKSRPTDIERAVVRLSELRSVSPTEMRQRIGANLAQLTSSMASVRAI